MSMKTANSDVALIITLKNEKSTVPGLFRSIAGQSIAPNELIIVDGGSTDNTISQVRKHASAHRIKVHIIKDNGGNIAHSRNVGIRKAKSGIIAVTDGSCVLDSNWLKNISAPLRKNKNIIAVFGRYQVLGKSPIGKCFAAFCNQKTKNQKSFLQTELSSRSVAFRKSAWIQVEGYPEKLTLAGEDTLFFRKLKAIGKCVVADQATLQYYHGRESLVAIYRVHKRNGIGSGEAGNNTMRFLALYGIYAIIVAGLFLSIVSGWFAVLSATILLILWIRGVTQVWSEQDAKAAMLLPILHMTRDVAMMAGFLSGSLNRMHKKT